MQGRSRTPRAGSRLRRGLLALSAVGLLLALPSSAAATTITVNTTVDELGSGPRCSLREAVWSSNNDSNAQAPGCLAGAGTDTIRVPAGNFRLNRQATCRRRPPRTPAIYGDLDVTQPVNIVHVGLRPTVVTSDVGRRARLPQPRRRAPACRLAGPDDRRRLQLPAGRRRDPQPGASSRSTARRSSTAAPAPAAGSPTLPARRCCATRPSTATPPRRTAAGSESAAGPSTCAA